MSKLVDGAATLCASAGCAGTGDATLKKNHNYQEDTACQIGKV
jgi:hypothetical protein